MRSRYCTAGVSTALQIMLTLLWLRLSKQSMQELSEVDVDLCLVYTRGAPFPCFIIIHIFLCYVVYLRRLNMKLGINNICIVICQLNHFRHLMPWKICSTELCPSHIKEDSKASWTVTEPGGAARG